MKIIVQRVLEAFVKVEENVVSHIDQGYCLFVGICQNDTLATMDAMAKKVSKLRIFEDEHGKMNHDIHSTTKEVLSISQFTLCAETKKGNRPSFTNAMNAQDAKKYFDYFNKALESQGLIVKQGVFQAEMKVHLINDGPLTIILEENHDTHS